MNRKYFSASLLLILLLLVMPFSLGGCSKDSPKRAVKKELNLIKELDESTIKAFVSYEDMMSSHSSSSDVGIETTEAVKRFFQNFDYKIKSSSVEDQSGYACPRKGYLSGSRQERYGQRLIGKYDAELLFCTAWRCFIRKHL